MPRILIITAILLFTAIGLTALFKAGKNHKSPAYAVAAPAVTNSIEIELEPETKMAEPNEEVIIAEPPVKESEKAYPSPNQESEFFQKEESKLPPLRLSAEGLPSADRVNELFNTEGPKLPIVETISYKSRVDWQKGSPAWISDYASHYATSRHFIARSLNKKPDYFKQDVADGNRFNIFKPGKSIHFYLVVDTSRCRMWLYYLDGETQERVLLKAYQVGLGRVDATKGSGLLTPLGQYSLGNRIAIYKPAMMGNYKGKQTEMIQVFGTRWIPFDKEIKDATAPAKGFGIHGVPWVSDPKTGKLAEDLDSIGKYESDGCIRMATQDIEEIYAIIITKPSTIVLVKDFYDAKLPGSEKKIMD